MVPHRGYFHQPAIRGESVAFVCEDDVWLVNNISAPDAVPIRITTDGCCAYPVFSRSGKSIAYSSFVSGAQEVYVVDCEGGPATQITRFGADTYAVEWALDDASLIVSSNCKQARL